MEVFLANLWHVLLELAPWLLGGALVAGVMHVALPRNFIARHMGGRGAGSVLKAALLGVPLPLCSCGVIPAAMGMKRDGASDGASVGFLISTPQTGVDSILVASAFLGWPFAIFKLVAAFVTGVAGGLLTDLGQKESAEAAALPQESAPVRRDVRTMLDYAVNDLIYAIWRWIVLGVVVSAALTTWVPDDFFADTAVAGGALALLAVLLISLPLYVCATASVPIAASLVAAGMPLGAAMVFLMAGPASNVATIGAVFKTFGGRVLAIYLSVIIGGSLLFGYLFDFLLSGVLPESAPMEHGSPVEVLASVLLCALFAWYAYRDVRDWLRSRGATEVATTLEFGVSGLSCGGCAKKATSALLNVEGVVSATVDHEAGRAVVGGTNLAIEPLRAALDGHGFSVTEYSG